MPICLQTQRWVVPMYLYTWRTAGCGPGDREGHCTLSCFGNTPCGDDAHTWECLLNRLLLVMGNSRPDPRSPCCLRFASSLRVERTLCSLPRLHQHSGTFWCWLVGIRATEHGILAAMAAWEAGEWGARAPEGLRVAMGPSSSPP